MAIFEIKKIPLFKEECLIINNSGIIVYYDKEKERKNLKFFKEKDLFFVEPIDHREAISDLFSGSEIGGKKLTRMVFVNKFKLINTFDIVVPKDYNHSKRLDSFSKKNRRRFHYYNWNITDKNYKATVKLEPGCKFKVKIFGLGEARGLSFSSEECLKKLHSEKAILVGAQGLSLVWEQKKEELLVNRRLISFDEKKALWKDANSSHGVPAMYYCSEEDSRDEDELFSLHGGDGLFNFNLINFEYSVWGKLDMLLCFCEE